MQGLEKKLEIEEFFSSYSSISGSQIKQMKIQILEVIKNFYQLNLIQ